MSGGVFLQEADSPSCADLSSYNCYKKTALFFFFLFEALGIEPKTSHVEGKCSATELFS